MDAKLMNLERDMDVFPLQTIKFPRTGCSGIQNGLSQGTAEEVQGLGHTHETQVILNGIMADLWGSAVAINPFSKCDNCPWHLPPETLRGTERRKIRKREKKSYKGRRHLRDCQCTWWDGRRDHISPVLLSNGWSEFCCESPSFALSSKRLVLEQIIFVPYIRLLI